MKLKLADFEPSEILICDIVKAELYFGAFKSLRRDANLALLESLFVHITSLPFDGEAAWHFGEIRAGLEKSGQPIGPFDLQIAAIALANDVVLVTHNTREFSRIHHLKLTDWI